MRQPTETTFSDTFVLKVLQKHRADDILPLVVFMLGFVIRSYRLSQNPLWLDEIYGYLLASQGLPTMLLNSLSDPHPPLYYILQWMTTGFGAWNTEWGLRWFPLLIGSLTVPLVYLIAEKLTNRKAALIAAIIIAFSPTHIYYSQESRSYAFVTFLAALSSLLTIDLLRTWKDESRSNGWSWNGVCFVSILGLYSSYSYLLVVGVQVLFLGFFFFCQGRFWVYIACLSAGFLGLIPFLFSLRKAAVIHADGIALDVVRLAQALLAGEPVRYGFHWPHEWLPPLLVFLAIIGAADSIRRFSIDPSATLLVLQVFLPVAILFGVVMPLSGLRLPVVDNKQFNVLQPAFYVLVSLGFGYLLTGLGRWVGRLVVILIFLVVVAGSLNGLTRYWSITKSPEGLAVWHVRENLRVDDEIISLHYSTDAALDFYLPNTRVYSHPIADGDSWTLSITDPTYRNPNIPQPALEPIGLDQVWGNKRIWLLSRDGYNIDAIEAILNVCLVIDERAYPPFAVRLLADCR